jgi:hypothetical protein
MRNFSSSSQQPLLFLEFRARITCGRGHYILSALLLMSVVLGCSRPRKAIEEVDWGQSKPRTAQRLPLRERRAPPRAGDATAPSAGEAAKNGTDQGKGSGGSKDGDSSPKNESSSGDVASSRNGEAAGEGPGGVSDTPSSPELKRPMPALPGRQPTKPELSAAEAARSAKQLFEKSQRLLRTVDASAAAEAALEAYDQVLPHAESDAECRKLCRQIEGLLNAAGRGSGQAEAVPTRFE